MEFGSKRISLRWNQNPNFRSLGRVALVWSGVGGWEKFYECLSIKKSFVESLLPWHNNYTRTHNILLPVCDRLLLVTVLSFDRPILKRALTSIDLSFVLYIDLTFVLYLDRCCGCGGQVSFCSSGEGSWKIGRRNGKKEKEKKKGEVVFNHLLFTCPKTSPMTIYFRFIAFKLSSEPMRDF